MTQLKLVRNTAGGLDLVVEKDAGNVVKILTGKQSVSLKFWKELYDLADRAVPELDVPELDVPEQKV